MKRGKEREKERKRILAFGDSNTWGWCPENLPPDKIERWSDEERWTGVMQRELGEEYIVINEGLNARTSVWDDPVEEDRNGKEHIGPIINMHAPLDLVIIFLGTNDLKQKFNASEFDIASGVGQLVDRTLGLRRAFSNNNPKVLVIVPPRLCDAIGRSCHKDAFRGGSWQSQ